MVHLPSTRYVKKFIYLINVKEFVLYDTVRRYRNVYDKGDGSYGRSKGMFVDILIGSFEMTL